MVSSLGASATAVFLGTGGRIAPGFRLGADQYSQEAHMQNGHGGARTRLTAFSRRRRGGADSRGRNRAAEARHPAGETGRSARREAPPARRRPARPLPVSRGQDAVVGDRSGEEPLALPRRVPGGRERDRLGDACRRRELPPRGGEATWGISLLRRCFSLAPGFSPTLAEARTARDFRGRRRRAPRLGGVALRDDARDEPGGAGVSGRPKDWQRRGSPRVSPRFFQPHARLPDARGRVFPGPRGARPAAGSRRFPHERPRAPGRLGGVSALRRRRSCGESVREKDRRAAPRWDAGARVFAQAPVAVCGTPRPSPSRGKSSSARRSSTR
jgi:hypothetical protein